MPRDASLLLDMIIAAEEAIGFISGVDEVTFMASRLHQNAVIRCIEIIGEAAGKVSDALRSAHPEIPWQKIRGMRHRLIHGYSEVELDIVWDVVSNYLPELIVSLRAMVPPERP